MIRDQLPNLDQFFAAYFHEDWFIDHPNPEAVIADYLKSVDQSLAQQTLEELSVLIEMNLSEAELREILIYDLTCNYDPNFDGKSYQEWLKLVELQVKNSPTLKIPAIAFSR